METAAEPGHAPAHPTGKYLLALSVGALGVVYGDIGTSPLYALKEAFHSLARDEYGHALPATETAVLGLLSLIFWSLMIIISVKYITFVLRADHHGQGGILALTTLVNKMMPKHRRDLPILMVMGLFGTALLFGDGMLTPAVSVLSAVEGLNIAAPVLSRFVVPLTVVILIGLFLFQSKGTEKVGKLFGPVVTLWFATIAMLGIPHILRAPEVLWAVLPHHGLNFLLHSGWAALPVLGSIFLVMTGGEAMYADLGHFGARPIRIAWVAIVFPALLMCYFGQGAMLLRHPDWVANPFYHLVPEVKILQIGVVGLATLATVIASQALISGTFSVTTQALQLKYLPRIRVEHTSERQAGQIYVPFINWALMVACVLLVLTFRTSSNLAAAYGVAVTLDMLITTTLLYFFMRHAFDWSRWRAFALCGFFGSIELVFFAGNVLKIPHGGWFPLVVGGLMFFVMSTWTLGRKRIASLRAEMGVPLQALIQSMAYEELVRVPGTAIFMHRDPTVMPPALLHNINHNQVLHRRNIICSVAIEDRPYVPREELAQVEDLGSSFYSVQLRFGYMDKPDVPAALHSLDIGGEPLTSSSVSYFLSRETILPRAWLWSGMGPTREKIFALLSRNAEDATAYFNIPPALVMEVGSQIEI